MNLEKFRVREVRSKGSSKLGRFEVSIPSPSSQILVHEQLHIISAVVPKYLMGFEKQNFFKEWNKISQPVLNTTVRKCETDA